MKRTTIIFDFDGTIADSFSVILAIFHELTGQSKLVTPEEIVRFRRMPVMKAVKELDLPKWRIPFLLFRGRRKMARRLDEVLAFGGMREAIQQLHTDGFHMFIVSSNSTANVRNFLGRNNLNQYFQEVYGGIGIFGKAQALKQVMKRNGLSAQNCVYIGDEPRDIEASKRAGVECIAASWGFNAAELLEEHHPYALAHDPEELGKIITRWSKA